MGAWLDDGVGVRHTRGKGRGMAAGPETAYVGQAPGEREIADLYPAGRLALAAEATADAGLGALLLTPGPDLRYLTGYSTHRSERLTCLAVPAQGPPFLLVPRLELASAQSSPAAAMDLEIIAWEETDDPFRIVAQRLAGITSAGLAEQMWAMMVLRFRDALPCARPALAGVALRNMRVRN